MGKNTYVMNEFKKSLKNCMSIVEKRDKNL